MRYTTFGSAAPSVFAILAIMAGGLFVLTSCTTNPLTGKKHFNMVPEAIEANMGLQAYDQIKAKEKISKNPRYNELVRRVGSRIAEASGQTGYSWEFTVIESEVQNAFCLPGGKIVVYTGILPIAKNEGGLATVLGHEVTHALARHGGERITQNIAMLGGLGALQYTLLKDHPQQSLIMGLLGAGATVGVILPFGRADETEADETGQILMARAGYDPAESVAFWQRFSAVTAGKSPPEFLSTHPSSQNRVENLQNRLAGAEGDYRSAQNHFGIGENF